MRRNGKAVDPRGGPFPTDDAAALSRARQAAQETEEFGNRAAEAIARLNERFDEQPRLVDQAAAATRQLDAIIAELSERKPPGFEKMIEEAERARSLAASSVDNAITRMRRESDQQYEIQMLIVSGKDREAAAVERVLAAQERLGDLLPSQVQEVREIAEAEYDRAEAIERVLELQSAYLDATRSVRSEVEAILAGQGKLSNLKNVFQRLKGQVLAEQLFGDVFRDLDKWVKEKTGIGSSVDGMAKEVDRASGELSRFASAVSGATSTITTGAATGVGSSGGSLLLKKNVAGWSSKLPSSGNPVNDNEIVVVAATGDKKGGRTVNNLTPEEYFDNMADRLGHSLTAALNGVFDTTFFSRFSGVLGGALGGYATGGAPGGIIGALKGIDGLPQGIADALGKAGKGAATGSAVAGIGKALGIGMSSTGAQIGGAIGSFIPIPGGDIIGAIAGGIIGKLIGGTKRGSATIGGVDGALGITGTRGNSGSFIKASSGAADSIIGSIERIAEAFGASVNASLGAVSIGIRDGKYRVDTTGSGITKTSRGAIDFGKDGAEAAARAAALDLIKDGVIVGLRAGVQTLLKEAKDLDTGLQNALDFQSIFDRLKAYKDPIGSALDTVDREFTRLRDLAKAAGEGMAETEELYWIERKKAFENAKRELAGSLQSLYDDLTIGDNGLSLGDRLKSARAAYDPLRARVASGDFTANDEFATAAQNLLQITREMFGSQAGYFDVFNDIKGVTGGALTAINALADTATNRDNPFSSSAVPVNDNAAVVQAINDNTTAVVTAINQMSQATQQNLAAVAETITQSNPLLLTPGTVYGPAGFTGTGGSW